MDTQWWETYKTQLLFVTRGEDQLMHLIIERHDRQEVQATWSEIQVIKNEIAGPDVAMYEVYPSEGNVVNEVNKRHFWSFSKNVQELKLL